MEPLITTKPPGPSAVAVLKRDAEVISQSMARHYPLVLERAQDVNLWDVDGNRYLDFTAGFAVMNVGWNHPKVVNAIQQQATLLTHGAFLAFCSETPVTFAQRLTEFLPPSLNRVCLTNSGAESVEAAMKLARYHTGENTLLRSPTGSTDAPTERSASLLQRQSRGQGLDRSCRFCTRRFLTRIARMDVNQLTRRSLH